MGKRDGDLSRRGRKEVFQGWHVTLGAEDRRFLGKG